MLSIKQFTSLKHGALNPFHVESPVSYFLDFQEFCTVVHLDWKDFLKTDIIKVTSDTQFLSETAANYQETPVGKCNSTNYLF